MLHPSAGSGADLLEDTQDPLLRSSVPLRPGDARAEAAEERDGHQRVRLRRRGLEYEYARFTARTGTCITAHVCVCVYICVSMWVKRYDVVRARDGPPLNHPPLRASASRWLHRTPRKSSHCALYAVPVADGRVRVWARESERESE